MGKLIFRDAIEQAWLTHPSMARFHEIMVDSCIDDEAAKAFLQKVWVALVTDEQCQPPEQVKERYFRGAAQAILDEERIKKDLADLQRRYPGRYQQPYFLPPLDIEDQRVLRSFGGRKDNPALALALYLLDDAIAIFGQPVYEAVAIAVSVAIETRNLPGVEPESLKQAAYRRKQSNDSSA